MHWVKEIAVNGVAEAVDHDGRDHQRHAEIEILAPKTRLPGLHRTSNGEVGMGGRIVAESIWKRLRKCERTVLPHHQIPGTRRHLVVSEANLSYPASLLRSILSSSEVRMIRRMIMSAAITRAHREPSMSAVAGYISMDPTYIGCRTKRYGRQVTTA